MSSWYKWLPPLLRR